MLQLNRIHRGHLNRRPLPALCLILLAITESRPDLRANCVHPMEAS